MQAWVQSALEWLIDLTHLQGYYLLLLTIPLMIIQGILSIFPFASILLVHVSSYGWFEGIVISWTVGSVSALLCFYLTRTVIQAWIERRFADRLAKYHKWLIYIDHYGGWVIIFLRTIPFVPNNIVSILAAVSQLRGWSFIWSSTVGMLSQVWMFGLLSSEVIFPEKDLGMLWRLYMMFCGALLLVFLLRVRMLYRKTAERESGEPM